MNAKHTKVYENGEVIGVLVKRSLVNDYGSLYGREYVLYTKPGHRKPNVIRRIEADLATQGIEHNSGNMWDQTWIYWGVTPEMDR